MRVYEARAHGFPEHHYHFCESTQPCDYNCHVCGKLVKEWGRLPSLKFHYGCCRLCAEYATCENHVARNVAEGSLIRQGKLHDAKP